MSRTTTRTGIRIGVVTGAAVLCAGASVPAIAHGLDSEGGARAAAHHQPSFAHQKERALRMLAHESQWLTGLEQKVAADDRLTADQKSAFTSKLDDALKQVAAARTAVENADTRTELRAALGRAELPYLAYPKHVLPTLAEVKADAARLLGARQARLTDLRRRVAADDRLTAAQKSAFTAKVDAALADLARAKDAVEAASTRSQVTTALAGVSAWGVAYPRHQHTDRTRTAKVKLVSATARPSHRSLTVHRAIDPRSGRHGTTCTGHGGADRGRDGDHYIARHRREDRDGTAEHQHRHRHQGGSSRGDDHQAGRTTWRG
jgi:hypothetical protein